MRSSLPGKLSKNLFWLEGLENPDLTGLCRNNVAPRSSGGLGDNKPKKTAGPPTAGTSYSSNWMVLGGENSRRLPV